MQLKSNIQDIDVWEWDSLARQHEWTDGLPVLPPTEDRVKAILEFLDRDPQEEVGIIPPANGVATIEQIVIQCVMAGCLPEHVPVVIAALEAMLEPGFNLYGVQCTTNPCAPLVMVSGPIVNELGFHFNEGSFGGGSHASAAVGRAVRLILWNIGGAKPGRPDMATIGQPAKYIFCAAENPASPWGPIHTDFGLSGEQSAVTVFACQSPDPIFSPGVAARILRVIASSIPTPGVNMFHAAGQYLLTFSLRPAEELARSGYTKQNVREWLFENARFNLGQLRHNEILVEGEGHQYYWGHGEEDVPNLKELPDETMLPMVKRVEDIHILVSGGVSQWWLGFSAGWGNYGGYAECKPVQFSR